MPRSAADVKKDVEEVEMLMSKSERNHVKNILQIELQKLQTELSEIMTDESQAKSSVKSPQSQCPTSIITNYGVSLKEQRLLCMQDNGQSISVNPTWDQSNKYVKIYIDLKNVQHLPKESITYNFEEKSMDLTVCNLDNKNYRFGVKRLAGTIIPAESFIKIKTDSFVIMMMKTSSSNWAHVTETAAEKSKEKTKTKPTLDEGKDPSEGIMDILKNIYEEGDDDMKRTINQAWFESRNKSSFD